MFIDQARIHIEAGSGGRGSVSFRREKFVPRGGPDGGDGGKGGDVYIVATSKKNTLLDFRYKRTFKATRGMHGEGSNRTGRSGEDLEILVPPGTVIRNSETGDVIGDLNQDGARVRVARGGRGGHGNAYFVTPTAQAPDHAQPGEAGEEFDLELELKLLADVGLVGLPNAGKSTLLSKISAAKPKIAAYPFTTLEPLLGTVRIDDNTTVVVADIPGLIEGASEGHGLGLQFLRHIERTKILLHLVDVSEEPQTEPAEMFRVILNELKEYGKDLAKKRQIVVATKLDAAAPKRLASLKALAKRRKLPFVAISAVTNIGLQDLLFLVKKELNY